MPAHLLVAEMLGLAPTARFLSALSKTSRARDVVGRWTRQGRNVPVTWREGSGEEEDSTDDEEVTVPVLEQSSPAAAEVVDLFKQAVGLPSDAYRMRLEASLADALGTSGDVLTSWRRLNEGNEAVDLAVSWLYAKDICSSG
ncbi:DTX46 [Symbiodinium natans]|uniref:DTX46 protein n=1 Tax=Symbiodinium natans TaxID=878477 RepID=A0A812SSM2_9DINO|nr:DTX46 [Symbiodinium natans]